jgi:hypothetical protein
MPKTITLSRSTPGKQHQKPPVQLSQTTPKRAPPSEIVRRDFSEFMADDVSSDESGDKQESRPVSPARSPSPLIVREDTPSPPPAPPAKKPSGGQRALALEDLAASNQRNLLPTNPVDAAVAAASSFIETVPSGMDLGNAPGARDNDDDDDDDGDDDDDDDDNEKEDKIGAPDSVFNKPAAKKQPTKKPKLSPKERVTRMWGQMRGRIRAFRIKDTAEEVGTVRQLLADKKQGVPYCVETDQFDVFFVIKQASSSLKKPDSWDYLYNATGNDTDKCAYNSNYVASVAYAFKKSGPSDDDDALRAWLEERAPRFQATPATKRKRGADKSPQAGEEKKKRIEKHVAAAAAASTAATESVPAAPTTPPPENNPAPAVSAAPEAAQLSFPCLDDLDHAQNISILRADQKAAMNGAVELLAAVQDILSAVQKVFKASMS